MCLFCRASLGYGWMSTVPLSLSLYSLMANFVCKNENIVVAFGINELSCYSSLVKNINNNKSGRSKMCLSSFLHVSINLTICHLTTKCLHCWSVVHCNWPPLCLAAHVCLTLSFSIFADRCWWFASLFPTQKNYSSIGFTRLGYCSL